MKMIYVLYKTTNLKTDKFYIGVHSTNDELFGKQGYSDPYVGSGKKILMLVNRYGRQMFRVEVINYFECAEDAYKAESILVNKEWLLENKGITYNINLGGVRPPIARKGKRNRRPLFPNGYNSCWITNGDIDKVIKRDANIPEGFRKGRSKMSQRMTTNNPMFDRMAVSNFSIARRGVKFSEEHKLNMSNAVRGSKWITNGIQNKKLYPEYSMPEGFKFGRTI